MESLVRTLSERLCPWKDFCLKILFRKTLSERLCSTFWKDFRSWFMSGKTFVWIFVWNTLSEILSWKNFLRKTFVKTCRKDFAAILFLSKRLPKAFLMERLLSERLLSERLFVWEISVLKDLLVRLLSERLCLRLLMESTLFGKILSEYFCLKYCLKYFVWKTLSWKDFCRKDFVWKTLPRRICPKAFVGRKDFVGKTYLRTRLKDFLSERLLSEKTLSERLLLSERL
jgi:hypothetical protein